MKNRFLNICIGASILLLSAGFFVRSISTADAAPSPENFQDAGTNKIGKYAFQVMQDNEGRLNAVIMDTETGKSKFYSYGYHSGVYCFTEDGKAFPDNPMGQ